MYRSDLSTIEGNASIGTCAAQMEETIASLEQNPKDAIACLHVCLKPFGVSFRVWGVGCGWDLGFGVWGLEFRRCNSALLFRGSGFGVRGSGLDLAANETQVVGVGETWRHDLVAGE